jgi:hypothetical protein
MLFFILNLSLGLYITVSLFIASVYTTWREEAVAEYWKKLQKRQTNLKLAFTLLVTANVDKWKEERTKEKTSNAVKDKDKATDKAFTTASPPSTSEEGGEGERLLSLTAWTELYSYMHPHLQPMEAQILSRVFFLLLTTTSTSSCSQQDFLDLCEHLQSLNSLTLKDALPPKTELAQWVQDRFEHPYVQYVRSAVVVLVMVMGIKAFESARTSDDLYSPSWVFALDCVYTVWLCVEVGVHVWIHGWQRFWSSNWKRASFLIALTSVVGKVVLELAVQPGVRDEGLTVYRVAMFFRLIRVMRVPLIIKRFRLGLKSLVRVFTPLMELFIYLIVVYYVCCPSPHLLTHCSFSLTAWLLMRTCISAL